MTSIAGYPVGVQAASISRTLESCLNSYEYASVALLQIFHIHITTKVVTKSLRTYNFSIGRTFPWYVKVLTIAFLPCSIYFEISRWSLDNQPMFRKKRAIHWICDHMQTCTGAIFLIASIALAAMGQLGILIGNITTFSIHQIQRYRVLKPRYCQLLTTVNMLVATYFSRGLFSCMISVSFLFAEVVSSSYFLVRSVRQNLPIDHKLIMGKTVKEIENNPLHIHFNVELQGNVHDILKIFDEIVWNYKQYKKLLFQDLFWIKRVDTYNTDLKSYISGFRKTIERFIDTIESGSNSDEKQSIELCLKVFIQYLQDGSIPSLERQKRILEFAIRLRQTQKKGIDYLKGIAEEHYGKIEYLPLEQKILQLLYIRRTEIFTKFLARIFAEGATINAIAGPNIIGLLTPCIRDAFDPHIGIAIFSKDETSVLCRTIIYYAVCADEEIPAERYFCDRDSIELYTPQSILDMLTSTLEADKERGTDKRSLYNDLISWCQEQGLEIDVANKVAQIQKAKQHLRSLSTLHDEYYYCFNHLKKLSNAHLDLCYRRIKEDYRKYSANLETQGDSQKPSDICSDIQAALHANSTIESCLITVLLKIGVFQVKP